ncbi:MAG: anaerobic sulfatase maturase [Candidatus Nanopelagicales bacterium]
MTKPTGAVCNLDCEYCFFLSKEQLYPGSSFRMSDEVQERCIAELLAAHGPDDEVTVAYQGGEPTLMGLEFFRRSVDLVAEHRKPGQRVSHTIQTNGTLLDDEWGQFLAEHEFLVGLSVDGPQAMHDTYRVDKGGKPTFNRVMAGWEVLTRHGVDWNVLTTIHAANAAHALEVYRFLRDDLGATHIQLIPIVERLPVDQLAMADSGWGVRAKDRPLYRQTGAAVTHRSVTGVQYGRFLIDVFEEWARHDVGDVFVQMFDTTLAHWMGMDYVGLCVHAPTCGAALALEHTGDVYSCDHYVEPEYLLGSIAEGRTLLEVVDAPAQQAFGNAKRDALPQYCRDCEVRFACNGGCPKDRFATTPTGETGLHHLCAGYKAFFGHVDEPMRFMAQELRAGRDATGLRHWYAAADARRSRNDPCTCGSGVKWKRCHGGAAPAPARRSPQPTT